MSTRMMSPTVCGKPTADLSGWCYRRQRPESCALVVLSPKWPFEMKGLWGGRWELNPFGIRKQSTYRMRVAPTGAHRNLLEQLLDADWTRADLLTVGTVDFYLWQANRSVTVAASPFAGGARQFVRRLRLRPFATCRE